MKKQPLIYKGTRVDYLHYSIGHGQTDINIKFSLRSDQLKLLNELKEYKFKNDSPVAWENIIDAGLNYLYLTYHEKEHLK